MSDDGHAVRGRELVFRREGGPAIRVDRFQLSSGEVVAIIGPNGSGKTTFLWLLAGLLPLQSGRLELFGQSIQSETALRRWVTLLMEEPYLLRTTVRKNVEYGLQWQGLDRRSRRARVDVALDQVGMLAMAGRKAWRLSQGERKRVALARALAIRPPLLLLDEPTAQVDRQSAERIIRVIEVLRGHVTIVLATHDITQARQHADHIYTMVHGQLGDVSHENLFEVQVSPGQRAIALDEQLSVSNSPQQTGLVTVLLDPEEIRLSSDDDGVPMQVVGLINERETVQVLLQSAANTRIIARIARDDLDASLALDETVQVVIPTRAVHFIPTHTEPEP